MAEANCKPNYQSVMNYLYQMSGLIVDGGPLAGTPAIDYSRQALSVPLATPSGPKLNENSSERSVRIGVERRRGVQSLQGEVVFAPHLSVRPE